MPDYKAIASVIKTAYEGIHAALIESKDQELDLKLTAIMVNLSYAHNRASELTPEAARATD